MRVSKIYDWWAGGSQAALTVVLTSDATASQSGAFTLTITFSAAVTGFTVADITYSNSFLSSFATSDNIVFTVTVTPQGVSEDIALSVSAGVCTSGALSNEASNTLTITQWNPVADIGANVDMELNFRHTLGKTLSGIENTILGNTTAEGADAVAWTSVASGGNTVKHSGDWAYAQGLAGIETTSLTGRRYLHDGTNFEVWARVFLNSTSAGYALHLFQNNNAGSANRGIACIINVSAANAATMVFNVTNGASSIVINQSAIALATVPTNGQWYTVRITKTGAGLAIGNATYTIYLDGVSKFSGTNTGAITGTADSGQNLTIFRTSGTTFAYSTNSLIKDIVFIKASLSAGDVTKMTTYLAGGREVIGSGTTRHLFFFMGQSLVDGSTPSSSPSAHLQGPLNAFIFNSLFNTAPLTISNVFQNLDFGVNNATTLTWFGPNLSFGYAADQLIPGKVWICQFAAGAKSWYNQGTAANTYSTANASGLARGSVQYNWVEQCLRMHKFQFNSTMRLYLFMNEGQTDCISTNPDAVGATQPDRDAAVQASIKLNCTNYIKKVIDDFQAIGINTSDLHILIARMVSSFNPSTPNYTAFVNAAIDDIVANFATDNASYVGDYGTIASLNTDYMNIAATDGTHPNSADQETQGTLVNTYFSQFY
jgi:hypothetical protein